jgi:hypothetical protein
LIDIGPVKTQATAAVGGSTSACPYPPATIQNEKAMKLGLLDWISEQLDTGSHAEAADPVGTLAIDPALKERGPSDIE